MKFSFAAFHTCLLATAGSAFTSVQQPKIATHLLPLASSTLDNIAKDETDNSKANQHAGSDWVKDHFNAMVDVDPKSLFESPTKTDSYLFPENDWFSVASYQGPASLDGLQIKEESSPLAHSSFAGLLPDPPSTPVHALDTLESYHIEPETTLKAHVATKTKKTGVEHGWFTEALTQSPTYLKGLSRQDQGFPPIDTGIVPQVPPVAPSLDSFQNFHLEPVHYDGPAVGLKTQSGSIEWFSQTSPRELRSNDVKNDNILKSGSHEWFMEALEKC